MKVLILAEDTATGGIGRYCINLANGLLGLGVTVELWAIENPEVAPGSWLSQEAARQGLSLGIIPMRHRLDAFSVWRLRDVLQSESFQIIHSQSYRSNIVSRLAIQISRPRAISVNSLHGIPANLTLSRLRRWYFRFDLWTFPLSAKAIAVDQKTEEWYVRCGIRPERIEVIPNGVALPDPSLKPASIPGCREEGDIIIGFVGRLSYEKGIDDLAEVIAQVLPRIPQCRFLVVGDGPEKYRLFELQAQFGDRVIVSGWVNDVAPYYKHMQVLVMPSRTEGMPFVALEAMAHGIPIVAMAVGGLRDVITSEYDGLLISPDAPQSLTQALLNVVQNSTWRAKLSENAKKTIESRFGQNAMCTDTLQLYEHLLS